MDQKVSPTDEELMRRYLSGEMDAFTELYARHSPRVHSYLSKKLDRRPDVDELHQSVFLKFHKIRHQYDPKYPVLQWLFVIAKTTLVDFYRRQGRRIDEAGDISVEDAERIQTHENSSELSQKPDLPALEGLSADQRQAIEWRYMDDLTFEQIAKKLGKSESGVRQILSRAIRKLRKGSPS